MRYTPDWNSLSTYGPARWFLDAKFGIYTHWGPYTVPAYGSNGTWYPQRMYRPDSEEYRHHCDTYGHPSTFGYKDFIPMFAAERFDADEWAELFASSGAKFAGPVAEHHDGFSMWDSKVNEWNSVKMGPKRDIVGLLEKAIRVKGMKFATTFHHSHNWWFFPTSDKEFDCGDPKYAGLYARPHDPKEKPDTEYLEKWKGKLVEVIDAYRPDYIWFDFGLGRIKEQYRKEFLAYYYNKSLEWDSRVVVTYKSHHLPPGAAVIDYEIGRMHEMTYYPWITDSTIDDGNAWSYVADASYKSAERLIHNLVDRVAKNGLLLLNVGPKPDGSIPSQAADRLREIGRWLEINGEAIFETTPWIRAGEGPTKVTGGGGFNEKNEVRYTGRDVRFTSKGDSLYATLLGLPGELITIKCLGHHLYETEIKTVRMLGTDEPLTWRMTPDGLVVESPAKLPACEHAYVLRIDREPPRTE